MDYLGVDFSTIHMNSRPKYEREFSTSILVFHINWILQYGNANAMQGSFKLATPTLETLLAMRPHAATQGCYRNTTHGYTLGLDLSTYVYS